MVQRRDVCPIDAESKREADRNTNLLGALGAHISQITKKIAHSHTHTRWENTST